MDGVFLRYRHPKRSLLQPLSSERISPPLTAWMVISISFALVPVMGNL